MKNPSRLCLLVAVLLVLAVIPQPASAKQRAPNSIGKLSHAEKTVDHMSKKFWRGMVNVVTGVGEIPRQIGRSCRKDGVGLGLPAGIVNGIIMAPARVGVGAFEVVTFPIPMMPGEADTLAPTYAPILTPTFVWQSE